VRRRQPRDTLGYEVGNWTEWCAIYQHIIAARAQFLRQVACQDLNRPLHGGISAAPWHRDAGQARVRLTAVGVNFIDTYHRSGLYPLSLPTGLGVEGAGVVEAVGWGVTHVKPGDHVAYAGSTVQTAELVPERARA
jgi:hypothetical protein